MHPSSSPSIHFSRKSDHTWNATLTSPAITESLGMAIGRHLHGGEVVMLIGDLGVGKTVFVRGLAQACGVLREIVNSPTFTLVQEYHGTPHLMHADLYRIEKTDDLINLGWAELFDGTRVVIIEWADRLPLAQLPPDYLTIQLKHRGRQSRSVILTAIGPVSTKLCQQVIQNFQSPD
ncbi:MAG: tRNA (adenosine(37)-N6)-threonylcarbamoyltransferase complex ATPase subunit type 1 TsaE [Nitrospirota bacterium]|nr:tRNA (adenosine(37)-N6)-threonylcarbamoyltransferase complex ATPase subunit type 1 TsaE [Nitrospirota bacterium]